MNLSVVLERRVNSVSVVPSVEVSVHDTKADYSKIHEATGWEPEVSFEEGVERVCEPYLD
ncbi:UDP-glucose 4-epimerase [Haloferax denitrificans ATCC 35960]|uniref:UDP-glucose 4-epimerase n=2 Tax=Haloferax TaxID=2251 RepID=M0GT18_HALL2|nr:UDP-glucose 4-epimerase [Haloferax lucentense DSM 14919]EMA08294.1 UDP-glucose 4-epimerase [Haloferax denitrificans ATCC 35960]MBC9986787.1 UDP-glucose 4-epimerase [Haloferax sp. AS1]RDZ35287.1 UDP-glucose 4-epimerase [Haloferax sp. Atlit-24N]RLM35697.1 UDP-glucose 4-epimerase [Haloferax sp. Atlit-109R]RLM43546.1 UDP-glucose 4-epimerase [Haloferax sp. Atlit-105R]